MTYAIGYLVYGINFKELRDSRYSEFNTTDEEYFFETHCIEHYSGNGEPPLFLGIELGVLDEVNDITWDQLETMKGRLSPARITQHNEKVQEVLADPEVSKVVKDYLKKTPATIFITWGSS